MCHIVGFNTARLISVQSFATHLFHGVSDQARHNNRSAQLQTLNWGIETRYTIYVFFLSDQTTWVRTLHLILFVCIFIMSSASAMVKVIVLERSKSSGTMRIIGK